MTNAVAMIEPVIVAMVPGSAAVLTAVMAAINVGEHILGELGALMAADPTVHGPMPPASVPSVAT